MGTIKQDLIPSTNSNRPGTPLTPTHITVHETANTSIGANAAMHAAYVKGQDAQNRQVSWHYTVDDRETIQHLPTNEVGWHAGRAGNAASIGIELCVNRDGNFAQTRASAVALIQHLMSELGIGVANVVTHQHWTGKNCPANLLNDWARFKEELSGGSNLPRRVRVISSQLWVYNRPDWNARYTIVNQGEVFTVDSALTVNGSTMYRLRSGLYITGNTQFVELLY
ncbi:N-acetylmuramoyl-L-alanine amidase [Shouchella shacheensis]|uniref:N-acetylmuramoyl-L-alanine amidase n=1 Tax=Shouchella shacheensis TaxID=1649580 RepID=UPI00074018D2|nr:N-acetylmuramoyl-L-alanine amidase [Shouchella shacheensis]